MSRNIERVPDGMRGDRPRFPLVLCIAGIVSTGLGLAASAAGIQWGPSMPAPDGFQYAWMDVNLALAWTWLLVWPAIALSGTTRTRRQLAWELGALIVAAIPAAGVAAFLSGLSIEHAMPAVALQLAIAAMAMGAMSWRGIVPAGVLAGTLTALGVVLPVLSYFWAEFFPAAWQGWEDFCPVAAIAGAASSGMANGWVVGLYAIIAVILVAIPRRA